MNDMVYKSLKLVYLSLKMKFNISLFNHYNLNHLLWNLADRSLLIW